VGSDVIVAVDVNVVVKVIVEDNVEDFQDRLRERRRRVERGRAIPDPLRCALASSDGAP
jgi:hypothetical protein